MFQIDKNIHQSNTLPSEFYKNGNYLLEGKKLSPEKLKDIYNIDKNMIRVIEGKIYLADLTIYGHFGSDKYLHYYKHV